MSERVGYVGLGIMGRGMAHNLLKAGFALRVWNRTATAWLLVEPAPKPVRVRRMWRPRATL